MIKMKTQPITEFRERLLQVMELREKRQIDIHNDCGISKPLISQWLSGKTRSLNTNHLYTLSRYFNVSEPWLMGYDVPMERTPINNEMVIAQSNINRYVEHELANNEIEQIVKMLQESTPEQVHKIYETTKIFLDK